MRKKDPAAIRTVLAGRADPAASRPPWDSCDRVAVYGAGSCGRDVLAALSRRGIPVAYLLDRKVPAGTVVDGHTVRHPDDPRIPATRRRGACVVIAVFNAFADVPAIARDLSRSGYGRIVNFPELYFRLHDELGERFWLAPPGYYDDLAGPLADGLSAWDDEESRRLYLAVLRFRVTGDYSCLPAPRPGPQYFDPGMPRWKTPMNFVDCGSLDGDTLKDLVRSYGTAGAVAAFEPDPANFARLCRSVRSAKVPFAESTVLFPCAVWSGAMRLRFSSVPQGGGGGSHLTDLGDDAVQGVSLDEALHGFAPTLVKMDIEGAELQALQGARRTLRAFRPGLAVCVYHRPEHLFEVPLFVRRLRLGYRLHLRSYRHAGFDLVMYARPGLRDIIAPGCAGRFVD